jgi:hypothetical protein
MNGVGMGLAWGWHGVGMGLAWGWHGAAWGWHGVGMGLAWGLPIRQLGPYRPLLARYLALLAHQLIGLLSID